MDIFKIKRNKGFTLIELMIATTLFTIIVTMGMGSLVVSSNAAKASQKLRIAVDNINFAMESMTRELRTGMYYYCGNSVDLSNTTAVNDCIAGDIVAFKPQQVLGSSLRVAYEKVARTDGSNTFSLIRCEYTTSTSCSDVVSSNVDIQTLKFYVTGSNLADNIQPSVKILIKGVVMIKDVATPFSLQTMTAQRSSEN